MNLATLPIHYLYWHYLLAWRDGWNIYSSLLWFSYRFFSIPDLIKSWLSPWRRLGEGYGQGVDPAAWASAFIINTIMRLVGAVARTVLIAVGLISCLLIFLSGIVMVFVWLILPVTVLALLATGIYLVI